MQRDPVPGPGGDSSASAAFARPGSPTAGETPDAQGGVPTFPGDSAPTADPPVERGEGFGGSPDAPPASTDADPVAQDRGGGGSDTGEDDAQQLISPGDEETFRGRWQEVQNRFVDDPRGAVDTADALVSDLMRQLTATFTDHKRRLEDQWNKGEQADTEALRIALHHYRSFFNRLLGG
ncbi:hypothetical protein [Streptomyces sp. NPDC048737]|uniref:hypothetical protein n=1 Tax=unclassified Streptomyces TaxID=2593676 RepID=UPI00344909B2